MKISIYTEDFSEAIHKILRFGLHLQPNELERSFQPLRFSVMKQWITSVDFFIPKIKTIAIAERYSVGFRQTVGAGVLMNFTDRANFGIYVKPKFRRKKFGTQIYKSLCNFGDLVTGENDENIECDAVTTLFYRSLDKKVGKAATICFRNDRYAATIIEETNCTIKAQYDIAVRTDNNGYRGPQTWETRPDPSAIVQIFTKRKNGTWIKKGERTPYLIVGKKDHHIDLDR